MISQIFKQKFAIFAKVMVYNLDETDKIDCLN